MHKINIRMEKIGREPEGSMVPGSVHLHLAGAELGADGTTLGLIGACGSLCGLIFHLGVGRGMATIGYKTILMATAVLHSRAAVVVRWLVRVPLRAMIVVCEEPLLPRGRSCNQRTEGVWEPLRISETQGWIELL
jgi:hypothetical protein